MESNSNNSMTLVVDYSHTFKKMLNSIKKISKRQEITDKNFPLPVELYGHKLSVIAKLVPFAERDDFPSDYFRHATLFELVAMASTYPELVNENKIYALGSSWKMRVPYICLFLGSPFLGLWESHMRPGKCAFFLVTSKESTCEI